MTTAPIHFAGKYTPVKDLCVITSYFNVCSYRALYDNYMAFKRSIEHSNISLVTVECAFNDAPFQLEKDDSVIQVRSNSIMWQKERLINIALERVRDHFSKIAWLDADTFFSNPNWAVETSQMLNSTPVVQPFEMVALLPKGVEFYDGGGTTRISFAYDAVTNGPESVKISDGKHGHTGYAWAARSDVLEQGLFDAAIANGGDHMMAHALIDDCDSSCFQQIFFEDQKSRSYFKHWADAIRPKLGAGIGYIPGAVLHRWHGSMRNRRYHAILEKVARFGLDPTADLKINSDGCWEWNSHRPRLHEFVASYFQLRNEDED